MIPQDTMRVVFVALSVGPPALGGSSIDCRWAQGAIHTVGPYRLDTHRRSGNAQDDEQELASWVRMLSRLRPVSMVREGGAPHRVPPEHLVWTSLYPYTPCTAA